MGVILAESLENLWTTWYKCEDVTVFHIHQNTRGTNVLRMLALWFILIMEMQHIFPKDNAHLHMKSACLCICLISVTMVSGNFPKANSYQPNNMLLFPGISIPRASLKGYTKLLSKCILMAQHNSITLTAFFIFIFCYLKIYCSVP